MTLGHQPVAITRNDAVELYGLADQIGDHGQKAHVGIEPKHRPAVPDPVDGHRPDHLGADADRNSDERYPDVLRRAERDRIGLEQGMGGDVFDDQWNRGRNDLPDRRFRQAGAIPLVGAFVPADADRDVGNVVICQQRNDAVPHLQKRRKHVENARKRGLQPVRRIEDFGDLVDSRQRNLAERHQWSARSRFQTLDLGYFSYVSVRHGDLSIVLDFPRRLL